MLITYTNKIIFGEEYLQNECCRYIYDTEKVNIKEQGVKIPGEYPLSLNIQNVFAV